ncbi:MAG: ABC transporter ATP-binding protein [Micrococcales bacterium]|nr:ABC transporter ATP-binding protein [Micrococcales bacterium]
MTAHIECRDLVRIFSVEGVEVQALQGLNLTVGRGELTAVVGASGSGKSTLLNILSGLDVPTAGSAVVAGRDLTAMSGRDRIGYRRHVVGFVWQQTSRNLLPYLTASENVALALSVARAPRRGRAERIAELLELLGIGGLGDRRPGELSGGEQQRVAIAVALANAPETLLADEPTGELDEENTERVFEAMREVNRRLGTTVLIVTHDPSVADHVRRTVQIRDGRTSTEVLRRTRVGEAGDEHQVTEEFVVLDRVGRLQLPEEYIAALALRDRVRLGLEEDHVQVFRAGGEQLDADPSGADAPGADPSGADPDADAPGADPSDANAPGADPSDADPDADAPGADPSDADPDADAPGAGAPDAGGER